MQELFSKKKTPNNRQNGEAKQNKTFLTFI